MTLKRKTHVENAVLIVADKQALNKEHTSVPYKKDARAGQIDLNISKKFDYFCHFQRGCPVKKTTHQICWYTKQEHFYKPHQFAQNTQNHDKRSNKAHHDQEKWLKTKWLIFQKISMQGKQTENKLTNMVIRIGFKMITNMIICKTGHMDAVRTCQK